MSLNVEERSAYTDRMDNFKFMDSWPAWVRWLLVLPVAAACYSLSFGLFIVMFNIVWHLHGSFNALFDVVVAICSAAFVWLSLATAPRFKLLVALVLALVPLAYARSEYAAYPVGGGLGALFLQQEKALQTVMRSQRCLV